MERLYCPECGNYLEGGDGSMVDCHCGWKQERAIESDDEEIEQLRQRVAELEGFHELDTKQIAYLFEERDALKQQRDELMAVVEMAYKVASEHDDRLPFDWAVYCEMLYQAIASVKEKS